jgi:dTDP-4-amino-4,6-dideoxygalactose transaminase
LLAHRLGRFDEEQAARLESFGALRAALAEVPSLRLLEVPPGVHKHGMYMLAARYQAEACGGAPIEEFVRALQAEGAPVHRGYASTIANQPVMRDLAVRRPEYVRALPTPVADQAARELLYIPGSALLAGRHGVDDIAHAVRKVQSGLSAAGARA